MIFEFQSSKIGTTGTCVLSQLFLCSLLSLTSLRFLRTTILFFPTVEDGSGRRTKQWFLYVFLFFSSEFFFLFFINIYCCCVCLMGLFGIDQVARLFGPAIFEASKLKVLFLGVDENKHPGNLPRTYTLTHSDITAKLTLAISQTINNSQVCGFDLSILFSYSFGIVVKKKNWWRRGCKFCHKTEEIRVSYILAV